MPKPALLCSLLLLCVCPNLSAAENGWVQVRTPHFLVISNGSEKGARDVAIAFERMNSLFVTIQPTLSTESVEPTVVLAAKDETTMKQLIGQNLNGNAQIIGMYLSGWEKDYAVVQMNRLGDEMEVVYHEYIHKILHLNFTRLPGWVDEGMAEFFAATRFRDKQTVIGAPSPRIADLGDRLSHSITKLVDPTPGFRSRMSGNDVLNFYAESWALTHFLMLSKEMESGRRFNAYLKLLQDGVESPKAFEQAIGPFEVVQPQFDQYTRKFTLPIATLSRPILVDPALVTARNMSWAETQAILGGYFAFRSDSKEAERRLAEALKEDGNLALGLEEMAYLEFVRGTKPEAQAHLQQALAASPQSYLALYYRTMLAYDGKTDPASLAGLDTSMQQILSINPRFAPAYIVQSRIYVLQNKWDAALSAAIKARNLQPDRAGYWTNVASILFLARDYPNALKIGQSVVARWDGPDAAEALSVVQRVRRAIGAEPTPEERQSEIQAMKYADGTSLAEGVVQSVFCDDGAPRQVTLRSGERARTFRFGKEYTGYGRSDVLWIGAEKFRVCQHAEGLKATIRYKPGSGSAAPDDLVWIELLVDLIPPDAVPSSAN